MYITAILPPTGYVRSQGARLPACLSFDLKLTGSRPQRFGHHGFLASPRARRVCRSAAPGNKFVKLHQLLLCEGVMREPQVCKHQVCVHCGGRFGMVTHRWWGSKFCKKSCRDAYLREVTLDRATIRRWFDLRVFSRGTSRGGPAMASIRAHVTD